MVDINIHGGQTHPPRTSLSGRLGDVRQGHGCTQNQRCPYHKDGEHGHPWWICSYMMDKNKLPDMIFSPLLLCATTFPCAVIPQQGATHSTFILILCFSSFFYIASLCSMLFFFISPCFIIAFLSFFLFSIQ